MSPLAADPRKPIFRTVGAFWASASWTEVSIAAAMTSATIFLLMGFLFLTSRLTGCVLLNHLIRSRQHIRRNRQADLLGGFQVDHQLELHRLFHGEFGGLGAIEDLIHVGGRAPIQITDDGSIGHKAALL